MTPEEWAETEAQTLIEDAEGEKHWSIEQFYEALVNVKEAIQQRIDCAQSDGVEL